MSEGFEVSIPREGGVNTRLSEDVKILMRQKNPSELEPYYEEQYGIYDKILQRIERAK